MLMYKPYKISLLTCTVSKGQVVREICYPCVQSKYETVPNQLMVRMRQILGERIDKIR